MSQSAQRGIRRHFRSGKASSRGGPTGGQAPCPMDPRQASETRDAWHTGQGGSSNHPSSLSTRRPPAGGHSFSPGRTGRGEKLDNALPLMRYRPSPRAGEVYPWRLMASKSTEERTSEGDRLRGILYLVGAAFFFSLMSLQVKLAGSHLPSEIMVCARGVVTLVMSWIALRRARIPLWGRKRSLLILRGLLGFGGLYSFYRALTLLPLAEVTVIHYLNPLLTSILAALILRERIGRRLLGAVVLSMAGVLAVTRPAFLFGGIHALNVHGVAAALSGTLFASGAYVTVRHLAKSEHPLVIVFYFPLVALPITLPLVFPLRVIPQGWDWGLLLGIGVTTQIAQVLLTRGLALVPAGEGTSVGTIQILFAALWGALIFHDIPGGWTIVGAALILSGLLLLTRRRTEAGAS